MPSQMEIEPITKQLEVRQPTALALMMAGIESGKLTAGDLQILQEMHFKELARGAEVEFNLAMNAVQAEITRVVPDAYNQQTKSKWATYPALDKMLRPLYVKNGFSLSFDSGESPSGTVIAHCYVSHRAGHTRKYTTPPVPLPVLGPQGKPVMTDTHGTGSAMSYAKRYLLAYIFNIPVGDEDTDGNGHPSQEMDDLYERLDWLGNCKDLVELQRIFADAYKKAKSLGDENAMVKLSQAKDVKKREFLK